MGHKVGRSMLQSLINTKIQNSDITNLVKKLLAAEKQAPSDGSDEDILTSTASRKFEDYSGFEDLLRRYARVFNLDGKNPDDAPSKKGKCATAACKRSALPNDSLCGTCSRLRAQGQL